MKVNSWNFIGTSGDLEQAAQNKYTQKIFLFLLKDAFSGQRQFLATESP